MKIHLKSTHPNEFKVLLKTCKEQIDLTKEMLCKEEARKNKVWKYFEEDETDSTVAVCQVKK